MAARLRTVWKTDPRDRERTIAALVDEIMDTRSITRSLSVLHQLSSGLRVPDVRSARQLTPGDAVVIRLHEGSADCVVRTVNEEKEGQR